MASEEQNWARANGYYELWYGEDSANLLGRYLRERVYISKSQRLKTRNNVDCIRDEDMIAIATELVKVKEQLNQLALHEAMLKEKLSKKFPISGWILINQEKKSYIIEKLRIITKPRLKTKKTLQYIEKKFGEDAARVVLEECSYLVNNNPSIYVRPFPKRSKKSAIDSMELDDEDLV